MKTRWVWFPLLALVFWFGLFAGCTSTTPKTDGGPPPDRQDLSPWPPKFVEKPLISMVNPFIGTGGSGFGVGSTFPGPSAPFGMLAVSPDTSTPKYGIGFTHCAGYAYGDDYIYGFSHLHLNGTGVPDFGNLLTMPVSGEVTPASFQDKEIRSKYDKSTERASPGYYTVTLKNGKSKSN